MPGPSSSVRAGAGTAALTLGALGVVFGDIGDNIGDIGTSPLYVLQRDGGASEGREWAD